MKNISALLLFLISTYTYAGLGNCKNVYVGSITAHNGSTVVVFKEEKENTSGSYSSKLKGWTDSEKKTAISLLIAAKLSGHRVNVATKASDSCSILADKQELLYVQLANNP